MMMMMRCVIYTYLYKCSMNCDRWVICMELASSHSLITQYYVQFVAGGKSISNTLWMLLKIFCDHLVSSGFLIENWIELNIVEFGSVYQCRSNGHFDCCGILWPSTITFWDAFEASHRWCVRMYVKRNCAAAPAGETRKCSLEIFAHNLHSKTMLVFELCAISTQNTQLLHKHLWILRMCVCVCVVVIGTGYAYIYSYIYAYI